MPPRRNNYYDATIRRMVQESLEKKTAAFVQQHSGDTDQALLEYLRQCAGEIGHSPHEGEILGWELISQRFGDWYKALELAGLPKPNTPNKKSSFLLYTQEETLQKQLYSQRKAEKKELARQRELERERKKKENSSSSGEGR